MTHTSTEQELYEKWRDDYALKDEPNYDDHLNADCKAAFIAGIKAARRAQVVSKPDRCHLCSYQHGHAIGCERNPIDIALAAAPHPQDVNHASAKR